MRFLRTHARAAGANRGGVPRICQVIDMKNPCTKDCPDRQPGCNCQDRIDWKAYCEEIKQARAREQLVNGFQAEGIMRSKEQLRKSKYYRGIRGRPK